MLQPDKEVQFKVTVDNEDTTFITFDEGGTVKVEEITFNHIIVEGDSPVPSCISQYTEPTEERFSWRARLPKEDKEVWGAFINSIQTYNR